MPEPAANIEADLEAWLAVRVPPQRLRHSLGVRDAVTELAEHYGADPAPLRIAALIHDSTREMPLPLALSLAKELGLPVREADLRAPVLLHGKLAAAMAEREFGLDDPAVQSAVRFHTAGHPGMSLSDKLFFLADHIEEGRSHPHTPELRQLAFKDVDKAMIYAINHTEHYLRSIDGVIDPDTIELKEKLQRGIDP